jgi:hypothetical protein
MAGIREERERRGRTGPVMAVKLREAAGSSTDVPRLNKLVDYIGRWKRGLHGMSARHQFLYCRALIPYGGQQLVVDMCGAQERSERDRLASVPA